MAKGINAKKNVKKEPAKTPKEKRQKRNLKRVSSSFYAPQWGYHVYYIHIWRCDDLWNHFCASSDQLQLGDWILNKIELNDASDLKKISKDDCK